MNSHSAGTKGVGAAKFPQAAGSLCWKTAPAQTLVFPITTSREVSSFPAVSVMRRDLRGRGAGSSGTSIPNTEVLGMRLQ